MSNHFHASSFSGLDFGPFSAAKNNFPENPMNQGHSIVAGSTPLGQYGLSQRVSVVTETRRTIMTPNRVQVHTVIDYFPNQNQNQQFLNPTVNQSQVIVNEVRTTRLITPSSTMNRLLNPNGHAYVQHLAPLHSNFDLRVKQQVPSTQFSNQNLFSGANSSLINRQAAAATAAARNNLWNCQQFSNFIGLDYPRSTGVNSSLINNNSVAATATAAAVRNNSQNCQQFSNTIDLDYPRGTGVTASVINRNPAAATPTVPVDGSNSQNYRNFIDLDYTKNTPNEMVIKTGQVSERINVNETPRSSIINESDVTNDQDTNMLSDEVSHVSNSSVPVYINRKSSEGAIHSLPHPRHGPYTCPTCKEQFSTSQKFANHALSHYRLQSREEKRRRLLAKCKNRNLYVARSRSDGIITMLPKTSRGILTLHGERNTSPEDVGLVRTFVAEIPKEGESKTSHDRGDVGLVGGIVKQEPVV